MKWLIFLLTILCLNSNVFAESASRLAGQVSFTKFDDSSAFIQTSHLGDDTDTGFGIFYDNHWSKWRGVKLGAIYHGEYTFERSGSFNKGETYSLYIAWSPKIEVSETLTFYTAIGGVAQFGDYESPDPNMKDEEDFGVYGSLELSQKINDSL